MSRKFYTQQEAEDYIREEFKYEGMGYGYWGKIVVKSCMIGWNADNEVVREYRNKFGKLYLTIGAYYTTFHKEQPQLAIDFRG